MDENIKRIDEKITAAKEAAENGGNEAPNADVILNGLAAGVYYADSGYSFINITGTSAANAECTFYMVNCDYENVCGYTSTFSAATAGRAFTATFPKGNWYYYTGGNKNEVNDPLPVKGTYGGGK